MHNICVQILTHWTALQKLMQAFDVHWSTGSTGWSKREHVCCPSEKNIYRKDGNSFQIKNWIEVKSPQQAQGCQQGAVSYLKDNFSEVLGRAGFGFMVIINTILGNKLLED